MFMVFYAFRPRLQFVPDGIEAVRFREKHGLPPNAAGEILCSVESITDRRAAESWPEGLQDDADLPTVSCRELLDMFRSGVVATDGPSKEDSVTPSLRLKPTCSPFELVQWRRAWAAEQRAKEAESQLAELRAAIDRDGKGKEEETE